MMRKTGAARRAWNPEKYLRFTEARMRPVVDLLGQIAKKEVGRVVDVGSGTGIATGLIHGRWPRAEIVCVDSSQAMLDRAEEDHGKRVCSFVRSDFESFFSSRQEVDFDRGEDGFDLVFSNAALHWIDFESQEKLFPKIMACLKPGGVFAFQMPDTRQQASHVSMQRAIENLGFQEDLKGKRCWVTTERDPSDYYKLLRPFCGNVDLWATEYTHVFHHSKEEEHPVVAFTSSTGLGPFVDALSSSSSEEKGIAFLEEEYDRFIREAYRPFLMIGPSSQFEEKVLFSMKKRFFCVASKKKEYY